ncbi:ABC transporter permease [Halococcus saccharolyticus]|uniref:Binding-protein-dependent transporters inner membrane component n=1 Tax=Halococcus saccharolyticus DSM 5350 TaxID=1227455 RepID=M0MQ24_9EURY|nr:ABC transporter permease [Halococcus saccharolyticus]EMA46550.1 binding-protein-dependent transporters inner membrane component [Halococcus saccharolyticus DSM 5350]
MIRPRTLRNLRRELRGNALAKVGIVLVVAVVLVAVFAPVLAPQNPFEQDLNNSSLPPLGFSTQTNETTSQMVDGEIQIVNETTNISASAAHPLGTDSLGRDMLSRVIYGARTSLLVGVLGTAIAAVLGVTVGLSAGYYGGKVDDALMRGADIMLAFPSLVLAVALVGLFGGATVRVPDPIVALGFASEMPPSFALPGTVIIVVALVNWVWFARVARGEALSITDAEYVKAARSVGASDGFILRKHVLPNSITPILVLATIQIAAIILLESSLSYLGFSGANLSWGFDIAQGRDYLATAWWISTMPGIAIVLTVIGVNLIGDWLRDALDPGIEGEGGGA